MRDLDSVIKAYDIRGVVGEQLDSGLAEDVGAAFTRVVGAAVRDGGPGAIVVGHDMRTSGVGLIAAFAAGVNGQGCDVVNIGLCSTDELYFASGYLNLPGAMFTASHNPAQYNGIKMCRPGARPVGRDTGLGEIRTLLETGIPEFDGPLGEIRYDDLLGKYAEHLRGLVELDGIRPLRVAVDAGNGMGGFTTPSVLEPLPLEIVPLYFELDGAFPNHDANPIDPKNLRDLQRAVRDSRADLGLAFDGDADRCFVIDERGEIVTPSTLSCLIAVHELARHPGATIIYGCITSRAFREVIEENGGVPERSRVGHSFFKARMAETGAVFGGEHSGHFYFRDFWNADSGMLAALHAISALGRAPEGTTLSQLLAQFQRYADSGEINTTVPDPAAVIEEVRGRYATRDDSEIEMFDGMTVSGADWWFNLRPSNTEPLLRLNVEAREQGQMCSIRDEVLAQIRGTSA